MNRQASDPANEDCEGASEQITIGKTAFAAQRWQEAVEAFEALIQAGYNNRETMLYIASSYDRLGKKDLATTFTKVANHLFPSASYDSTAAFTVYSGAPAERDAVAEFLVKNMIELRKIARSRSRQADAPARRVFMRRSEPTLRAFVYWDSAKRPIIVRKCIRSMRRHLPKNVELVELNDENLRDWVVIDESLLAKVESKPHLSDVIRLHLLSTYGGLWLDATCLLNYGFFSLFDLISKEDFFLYRYRGSRTGNWFFWAQPQSYRLQLLRAALDLWLSSGRPWNNYFMFHDFIEMLYWTDRRYRREWDAGLYLHPREALAMNSALHRPVADHEWFDLRRRSPINKLTWKFNKAKLDDPRTGVARLLSEGTSKKPGTR